MLLNHGRVCVRGNVNANSVFYAQTYPGHILNNTHNLACIDWRVRLAGVFFVSFKITQENSQGVLKAIRANRENRRCDLSELFKIKNHKKPLLKRGRKRSFPYTTGNE